MPSPSFENLDVFLDDWDEAQIGSSKNPTTIQCIFDNGEAEIFDERSAAPVLVKQPMLTAKSSDVDSLERNAWVYVDNTEYKVKVPPKSDGTGFSTVYLTKV